MHARARLSVAADNSRGGPREAGVRLIRPGTRAAASFDLSSRVAELAGEGLRIAEIAARLFVTPKTVEATLSRVYRKLGVRSRSELARQAPQHPPEAPQGLLRAER